MVTPARRLVYRFLELPYHVRVTIMNELGLFVPDEDQAGFFRRARERKMLAALWTAVEKRHEDPSTEPNPFEGQ